MKIKHLLFNVFALIGLFFFCTTEDVSAYAGTVDPDDLISQVKIFDENNSQIPYTHEELREVIKFNIDSNSSEILVSPYATYKYYNYGPMTFADNFYVGPGWNGLAFYNPVDTSIRVNGTARKIMIIAYNDIGTGSGTIARTIEIPGGWTGTIHSSTWSSLPRGKSYRFNISNMDRRTFTINNVTVLYD